MAHHIVAPSILAGNFAYLQRDIELVNRSEAQWLHVDVMDGVFVPNISFGQPVVKAIAQHSTKTVDVHLMIVQPERYIPQFRECGADIISIHYEATDHLHRAIQMIKDTGAQASVALNPHTPVNHLSEVIGLLDMVCLMSVNPGFGGQKFISHTIGKIKELKRLIDNRGNGQTKIEVDGGVDLSNAADILTAGADVLVAGSSVFKAENPEEAISNLLSF